MLSQMALIRLNEEETNRICRHFTVVAMEICNVKHGHGIDSVVKQLKQIKFSKSNRFKSIYFDSKFISTFLNSLAFHYPLIANLRCGEWYYKEFSGTCYFKSTDGHPYKETFSTVRLNLHLLKEISESGGCIIVDSTRAGKIFPDSFSKVVPIWCMTFNLLKFKRCQPNEYLKECLARTHERSSSNVCLPKWLHDSEIDRITLRLNDFLQSLYTVLDPRILSEVNERINKFLVPFWVYPQNAELMQDTLNAIHNDSKLIGSIYPIICLCPSSPSMESLNTLSFSYIQGAADDHELWCTKGFTSSLFWRNVSEWIYFTSDEEYTRYMEKCVQGSPASLEPKFASADNLFAGSIKPIGDAALGFYICDGDTGMHILEAQGNTPEFNLIISLGKDFLAEQPSINEKTHKHYHCTYTRRPKDCKYWAKLLDTVILWVWSSQHTHFIDTHKSPPCKILVFAQYSSDFSIVIFLLCAILLYIYKRSSRPNMVFESILTASQQQQALAKETLPVKPRITKEQVRSIFNFIQFNVNLPPLLFPRKMMNELMRYFNG